MDRPGEPAGRDLQSVEHRQSGVPSSGRRRACIPSSGGAGDPGAPAAELLRTLGIEPAAEGNRQVSRDIQDHLAQIRAAVFGDS